MGVGIVVGSFGVLPHPANSQMINAKLMICRNSFLVLMLVISIFLVEVILINYMVLMLLNSPTVWLSGSGGTGETPSHYRITSRNAFTRERRREAPPPQVPEGGSAA